MKIIRVFPSKTNLTPDDDLVRFGPPDMLDASNPPDRVLVSCTFTWDLDRAHELHRAWQSVCDDVQIGGPALNDAGGEFTPGLFLKHGAVITSRGCPNKCAYCFAQMREGDIRELPIREGNRIQDNNLLACSEQHILSICDMLRLQPSPRLLAGGLEARRFQPWHAKAFRMARVTRMYFANDRPRDIQHIRAAAKIAKEAGFTSGHLACFCLIGFDGDTMAAAEKRLRETWDAGMMPFAMLWRDANGVERDGDWRQFQRKWTRPAIIRHRMKNL